MKYKLTPTTSVSGEKTLYKLEKKERFYGWMYVEYIWAVDLDEAQEKVNETLETREWEV